MFLIGSLFRMLSTLRRYTTRALLAPWPCCPGHACRNSARAAARISAERQAHP